MPPPHTTAAADAADAAARDSSALMMATMPGLADKSTARQQQQQHQLSPRDVSMLKTDSFASTDTATDAAAAAAVAADAPAPSPAGGDDNHPLALRRRFFAPNATLAHADSPLALSRGLGCRLLCAETGRAYLDAQNNVAHLGHSHAAVAAAVSAQLLRLNTNSRYVSSELGLYCRELVETLPAVMLRAAAQEEPLVFLTNSGSEANDLALRVARANHAQRFGGGGGGAPTGDAPPPAFHVAVLGGAYHGHLDSVVRLSPYKFWAPGSAGAGTGGAEAAARTKPDWVHVIPLPDEFRAGRATRFDDGAAAARAVCAAARSKGGRIAFAIAESIPSCAGQCPLPPGYLAALFSTLRQEEGRDGVVCCVDEVQTGFGRVGHPHFWAFEPQLLPLAESARGGGGGGGGLDCLPDLISMGKPMGNGFPLAGLMAARRGAARAFCEHSGEPYFNTFGGSGCSVAAGRAVLKAVRDERLAERAAATGRALGGLLRRVAAAHGRHVRDVRGCGLFWGVEITRAVSVAPPSAERGAAEEEPPPQHQLLLLPAPVKAAWVARRMRDASGVLVSVDGIYGNVLKVKPPMCFGPDEARELADALDAALSELGGSGGGAGAEEELAALERREAHAWATQGARVREMYDRNARELGLLPP
jgi:ethanolamine-phosphate phospho-lyase